MNLLIFARYVRPSEGVLCHASPRSIVAWKDYLSFSCCLAASRVLLHRRHGDPPEVWRSERWLCTDVGVSEDTEGPNSGIATKKIRMTDLEEVEKTNSHKQLIRHAMSRIFERIA